jgi:hypothetical protein
MMKHIVFTLTIVLFSINAVVSQTVPNVQQSLITKVTATWCPNCGGWGWDFYEDLYQDNANKALMITAHYSGDLQNPTAQDFASNFNVNYQPYFILGNENQNVTPSNAASKRTEIKNQVDANYISAPIANTGLLVEKDGNMLNVTTRTRFFQQTQGEYYLGVYVIEDGVINFQQGQGDNAVHKNVLRASMSDSSFGEFLDDGTIQEFSEYFKTFSIELGSWNINNLEIATIIWEKVDNTYEFVNTNSTTELTTVGVSVIPENVISFNVYPTITGSNATIELDLKNGQSDIQLELVDPTGKKLATIFEGRAASGVQTFNIDKSMVNSNGLYFLMLRSDDAVSTKKIIFQ